ncbi:MAG: hypothetical protein RLZZ502_1925 [Pseudomonadota bacterium]|jgi:two-component system osmolarity sensor histidine kinase EnvZ
MPKLPSYLHLNSLTARLSILLLLLMAIGFAALIWGFGTERTQLIRDQIVDEKLTQLESLQAQLKDSGTLDHQQLRRLGMQQQVVLVPVERRPEIGHVPVNPRIREVVSMVRERLGADTEVRMGMWRDEPIMWVKIKLQEQLYWAGMRVRSPQAPFAKPLLWGAAGLMLLLIASAVFFAGRMLRPLQDLDVAMHKMAQGERVAQLPSTGVAEVRRIAERFNHMSKSLAELENERALMLAGISHDMRTPLARLRLQVEMASLSAVEKTEIGSELDELETHLSQFIEFARLSNIQKVDKELLDTGELLRELAQLMRKRGRECTLALTPAPAVLANRLLLKRALENLLENAYRYSDEHPVVLRLEYHDKVVDMQVIDQGPGIAAEKVALMKQAFTRGNSARGGVAGTGLGLAIVERIAQLHAAKFELGPSETSTGQNPGTKASLQFAQ